MAKREPYRNRIELLQGTLDMMIVRTLQWGRLHRLEKQGWLTPEWKMSEANRRAKYYQLTAGKRQLSKEQSKWDAVVKMVARVMRPQEG